MELQEKRREETPKKRGWLTGLLYWHLLPRVLGILVVILLAAGLIARKRRHKAKTTS